ncbi:DHA2 family efflux MFS transporter permease subunit [Kitasatospora sp. NBC_01287]|uniref:DHA2 family efflux MFS transporter permease subunit n=1 Tax=Kitasatospora sp. NBC_01287 TaxID=2903573 RepID=UPI00225A0F56|nr:DHA2 family efflux MFS transporter permease subunit [Kitasatospora sp. NBC_01287]MCX4749421.1 DHA2 family efflux MFS transporter permease subunit [Kitasatospora sp. NBC_01287]
MIDPTALTRGRRLLILAICCLSLLIVGLDNTIVNVALPSIQRDLHASPSGLQWVIDSYTLVLASLLILSGSVADRVGRRRIFQLGLLIFVLGSLLCSIAPSLGWLVTFRAVQAVGGSMLNPVAMSIITNVFTEPRERARAIGVWGGVVGISMALGPLVGGLLVDSYGWPSIFLINIPIGLLAIALAARYVPESRAPRPRRLDPVGQVLAVVALGAGTAVIIEGPSHGFTSPLILALLVAALAAMTAFPLWESRHREPLLDLRFFRSAPFSGATLIAVCAFAALGGFLFLNTLYLQDVRHYSPVEAGLWTLPIAAFTLVCAPISGRIVGARGPRLPLLVAGPALAASGLLLTGLTATSSPALLLTAYSLFGLGFGLVNAPITNAAVSGMPRAQAGVAAAVASTSRQVGQSLGVAVIGTVVTTAVVGPLATGFAQASHAGWWIIAGLGVAVTLIGLLTTTAWARATAELVAARLDAPPAAAPDGRESGADRLR